MAFRRMLRAPSPATARIFSRGFAQGYNLPYKRMQATREVDDAMLVGSGTHKGSYLTKLNQGTTRVTFLNNSVARNSMDLHMLRGIVKSYKAYDLPGDMIGWFLRSQDDKFFCPGPNFTYYLKEGGRIEDPENRQYYLEQFIQNTQGLCYLSSRNSKPAIVYVNGYVGDMGVALGFHGRTTVIGPSAVLTHSQTARGWFPDAGLSFILPRLETASLGMFLGMTGFKLHGYDIVKAGYVDHFMHPPHVDALYEHTGSVRTFDGFWDIFNFINSVCVAEADNDFDDFILAPFMDRIEQCFNQESVEQIYEELGKQGEWGQEIIQILNTKCPTSLKVTHRLLRDGASMNLRQCLEQEYRCALNMMSRNDFNAGLGTVKGLIKGNDVTKAVPWFPQNLSDIGESEVKALMTTPFGSQDLDLSKFEPFIPPNEVIDVPPFPWFFSNRANRRDMHESATERVINHHNIKAKINF